MKTVTLILGLVLHLAIRGFTQTERERNPAQSRMASLAIQLRSDDKSQRLSAARVLLSEGTNGAEEVMKQVVGYNTDPIARRALDVLASQGAEAVPMMLALLQLESTGLARHNPGISGLLSMGTNAISGLAEVSASKDAKRRFEVIDPLRIMSMDPETKHPSATILIRLARTDPDERIRLYAIDALGYFGLPFGNAPEPVCQILSELLEHEHDGIRVTAAYSSAKACRNSSAKVLAVLSRGVASRDKSLAWESAFALRFLDTNRVSILPQLVKALDEADPRTSTEIIGVFGQIGDPAFSTLGRLATNSVLAQRTSAINSLAELGKTTRTNLTSVLDALFLCLSDGNRDVRSAAINSLRRVAIERKEPYLSTKVAEQLRPLLRDQDEWIRDAVSKALDEIQAPKA